MANRSATFNGKTFTNPGVYSALESSMTYSKQSSGSKIIALIGESTGGEPNTVHFFSNPAEAKRVLKSGTLLTACNKAWNPVSRTKEGLQLGGADIIACIRANKATKAQKIIHPSQSKEAEVGDIIENVSDETTGTITVTGDYTGKEIATYIIEIVDGGDVSDAENIVKFNYYTASDEKPIGKELTAKETIIVDTGLTVSFTEGTYTAGDIFMIPVYPAISEETECYAFVSKDYGKDNNKIQVKVEDATLKGAKKITVFDVKSDTYEVFDNMGFAFSIVYTGEEDYATMSIITDGDGKAIKLQTRIGASKADSIIDLDVELDKTSFRTIMALVRHLQSYENYKVVYNTYCNNFCNVNDLDAIFDVDIKANSYTVTQMLSDMKSRLDNDSSFVTIEIYNKEVAEVVNMPYFALSGGSEGKIPASWVEYFDMLGRYDIQYIVPLTSDDFIMVECLEHVNEMSENFGLERRAVFGTDNGKTVTEACDIAQNLADDRAQLVYPGSYEMNENGEVELLPSYILAAQFAGRVAFLPDGETATHDVFKMNAIEKELEPEEIARLINAGVVTFEFKISSSAFDESYVQCVQDITTSREDDILLVERAVGVTADNINKEIRSRLDNLTVGKKTVVGTLTTIKNIVERVLDDKRDREEVIVAYKDVSVTSNGGVINISYACAPAQPNNFTFIKGHFYSEDLMIEATSGNE